MPKLDLEIARTAKMLPIVEIGSELGIPQHQIHCYGSHKGKVSLDYIAGLGERPNGKLILVTAITPTPAGEGKTTTTIGLGDGLRRIGKRAAICLREPSLGPCFGMKGGATGGGYAQVLPSEDINLHFTGDFHAISVAHNLLTALIDNHVYWGNELDIDTRRISWQRVMDMNDRALRGIACGLGGPGNGFMREGGFDIVAASEVMAILCLAGGLGDLSARLGAIEVAVNRAKAPIYADALAAPGAMAVLLKDALAPNLVQTIEHTPAFIHGGPFANIAHGCNSVLATTTALKLADYVVTEAGFGADLGAEKFFDIKCRKSGLTPDVAVIVATVRALKMHGGATLNELDVPAPDAVRHGASNLARHIANVKQFGVPVLVAINRFSQDTPEELEAVQQVAAREGVEAVVSNHWEEGSAGAEVLANRVAEIADRDAAQFQLLYPDEMPLWDKIETIARRIYGAAGVTADKAVHKRLQVLDEHGFGHLPVCMAKTQYSFATDPSLKGAPSGHQVQVREVRLAAGAGFVVVICGNIMTMPGLPRVPAAHDIHLSANGLIEGLS